MLRRRQWLGLGAAILGAGLVTACGSAATPAAGSGASSSGAGGSGSATKPSGPGTAVEDFTEYASDDDLNKAWMPNPNGDQISAALSKSVKADGGPTMQIAYTVGDQGYSGLWFNTTQDWSKAKGVQFVYQGDGSGVQLTFQFKDGNGEYWEAYTNLTDKAQHAAKYKWTDFKQAPWNTNPANALDAKALGGIAQVAFYFGQKKGSGTVYVGDIRAV